MQKLKGSTEPRLCTPPLRRLDRRTSAGYAIIEWAERVLGWKPLPWQRWFIIHANELLPGGALRFTKVLLLCARQNGKSEAVTVMSLYWMTHDNPRVLYSSAALDTAKDQWEAATEWAESAPDVFGTVKVTKMNGHWALTLPDHKAKYQIISANRRGGRGKPRINRAVVDELREHYDFDAMAAVESTMLTVPDSQLYLMSNAGDRRSVVLNHYRSLGISGEDPELFYAEWSALDGCEIDDETAWCAANPGLGYTITERKLRSLMGGPASVFRTENLCQSIPAINAAVDPPVWETCLDPAPMTAHKSRVVLAFDMSPSLSHSSLVAAVSLPDGRTRVEVIAQWETTQDIRDPQDGLAAWVGKIKPLHLLWIPSGPAAALSTDLKELPRNKEITGTDIPAACMGFAELVGAARLAHNGDEMLTTHVLGSHKLKRGDGWVFSRNDGDIDGAYAAAIAVHIARRIPAPRRLRVVTGSASPSADITKGTEVDNG